MKFQKISAAYRKLSAEEDSDDEDEDGGWDEGYEAAASFFYSFV